MELLVSGAPGWITVETTATGNRSYLTGLGIWRRKHFMRPLLRGETQCSSDLQQATAVTEEAKGETPPEFMEHQTLRA